MTEAPDVEALRQSRRNDTIKSIKRRRTRTERWSRVGELTADHRWRDRAEAAVKFIPQGARVLDLGCGDMKLEKVLPSGCAYLPVDVAQRDDRTTVVDLNKQRVPRLDADFLVGMGVLEYLFDMPKVLRQLSRYYPRGLLSYHPLEQTPARDGPAVGWSNALNTPERLSILKQCGHRTSVVHQYKPGLIFIEVSAARPTSPPT